MAILARERVDLPNNPPVVLQGRPLDEYSKCIYILSVITWDEAKRRANLRKHGFDFVDAEDVFPGVTCTYEDDRLAYGERRFVTLRKATKREREIYFESIAN